MSDLEAAASEAPRPTVFISYASEDREAARLLTDALPGFGLEVWYDESELGGGEAWDQKIRRQIRECDFFMPLVSAQSEARREGYFRREWRLAVERTLDMTDDHLFLLPIALDDTDQAGARVPEKFLAVQWLKVPGGRPTRALESLCRRLASGNIEAPQPARTTSRGRANAGSAAPLRNPEFPREEPGQRIRFWVEVVQWALRSAWVLFKRLPRWVRIVVSLWLCVVLVTHCESSRHRGAADLSPAKVEKLKAISEIAGKFADDSDKDEGDGSPLLAIPFIAPAGDAAAQKLARSAFATTYGKLSLARPGRVSTTADPLPSQDLGAALERGRANHSTYVLCGTIDAVGNGQALTVRIAKVADGSLIWSKAYPVPGTDPAMIAAEVAQQIPPLAPR